MRYHVAAMLCGLGSLLPCQNSQAAAAPSRVEPIQVEASKVESSKVEPTAQREARGRLEPIDKIVEAAQRLRWRGDETAARARMRTVLEREPDHFEARAFLGYEFFRGRWRLPEEIAYLRSMARRADPGLTAEQREAGDETVPTGKKPAVAKAPAAAEGRAFPFVAGAGRQRPRRTAYSATGLFDLRLQWVQVTGLATVPVGLGVGTGRLQLPTTQSVSFGGTVALPLGR